MRKYKSFRTIFFGFLILITESTTNPLKYKKITCSPFLPAQFGQFPHTVVIKTNETGEVICQGTLIDVNWVLTTAHCLSNIRLNGVTLTMGNEFQEIIRKPKKVAVETKYRAALIEIDKPVKVTDTVAPIELSTEDLSKNSKCIVSGLKKMTNNDTVLVYWNMAVIDKPKQTYNEIEMYFKDHAICREQLLWPSQKITENGMPLICNDRLYGMYTKNKPRVFVGLSKYNEWIQNVMDMTELHASAGIPDFFANLVTSTTAVMLDPSVTMPEDVEETESDDPTTPPDEEEPTTRPITVSSSPTSITVTMTEDVEETESTDPTSPPNEEEPTTRPITVSSSPTSITVTMTEDVEETESDDPTSPPDEEEPTTRPVTVSSSPTSTAVTVTEDVEETESDDPTSPPDEEETQSAFSTSPATTEFPTTEFPTTEFKTPPPIITTSTAAAPGKDDEVDSNKSSSPAISYNASLIITILCCLAVINKK
ncbi:Peptidase S1, PA clan,Serine proteases, trypsin domain [Cinara cedri]|uniref:Peptidase S1, PA clan,Serine proteases, trypsin domain n=1 Tax=Cinara cedri TaxID=506608 RepID=A0A5E4N8W9_9HEMI|nr:Peptidase S1, PA clan,Serine proteases, trypsin domain [Cinara cedri]